MYVLLLLILSGVANQGAGVTSQRADLRQRMHNTSKSLNDARRASGQEAPVKLRSTGNLEEQHRTRPRVHVPYVALMPHAPAVKTGLSLLSSPSSPSSPSSAVDIVGPHSVYFARFSPPASTLAASSSSSESHTLAELHIYPI
jgi:hypothetical protein